MSSKNRSIEWKGCKNHILRILRLPHTHNKILPSFFCRSAKFSSKIKYVNSLDELQQLIPMDCVQIPECIIK